MKFELTMRLFFGEKAYGIAGEANSPTSRRRWVKKVLDHLEREIQPIETTPRHQETMLATLKEARAAVGRRSEPSWELVDRLLALTGRLLGLDFSKGSKLHNVSYWQRPDQHYTADFQGGDVLQAYYDSKTVHSLRRETVLWLKEKGLSDLRVGIVLGISEYEVQKLRRDASAL